MKNKFILAGLSLIISSFSLVSCNDENKDITIASALIIHNYSSRISDVRYYYYLSS